MVNLFERGEASMGRINVLLDAPPEIRDDEPLAVPEIRGEVEFRCLSFEYQGTTVLHDIDLDGSPPARWRSSAPPAPARARW